MTRAASAKIIGGHNFRVLEVDGFPPVVFGCPPGLVKDFAGQHRPLPHHYVLPTQTIVQGRNHFDFEFIIYSFLFMKGGPVKASVYCTRSQKARFKAILNETLFGPSFQHLLQAQFRKLGAHPRFKASDRERFAGLLEDWAADKTLFRLYSDLLKAHAGDRTIGKRIAEYFQRILKKQKWLARKNIPRLESRLARNYIQCAQLKKEMDLFSLTGETGRSRLIDRIIDFHLFDKNHSVSIAAGNRRGEKLQVIQSRSSVFEVIKKDHKLCTVDLSRLDPPENLAHLKPVRKPWFGVTFLGVGSGFSARRRNSCLLAWSEGRALMVDVVTESARLLEHYGVEENEVLYLFLTHVHSDHDAGLIERILSGLRTRIVTTRIIFESFLRKLEAITGFPKEQIEEWLDFYEVEPLKKTRLPGFERTRFTFDYSLHSIPSGRFRLTCPDHQGRERVISHSGDAPYDAEKIENWYRQGVLSRKRREGVLGFIWDADLILHDVGGGTLHTKLKALDPLPDSIAERLVLVHQHEEPRTGTRYRFAQEGESLEILSRPEGETETNRPGVSANPEGARKNDVARILTRSRVICFASDEVVSASGEGEKDFYFILKGRAELFVDGKPFAVYESGKTLGGPGFPLQMGSGRPLVKARSSLVLLAIPRTLYKKFHVPEIHHEFYKIGRNYDGESRERLLAAIAD